MKNKDPLIPEDTFDLVAIDITVSARLLEYLMQNDLLNSALLIKQASGYGEFEVGLDLKQS